jgi:hypothetical protein
VADQRFEPDPVAPAVTLAAACEESGQPRRTADIDLGKHPLLTMVGKFEVERPYQARVHDIDHPVAQHIGAQQHLALAPLELPQLHPRTGQLQASGIQARDILDGDELPPGAPSLRHHSDHQRVVRTTQPDEDIGDSAE